MSPTLTYTAIDFADVTILVEVLQKMQGHSLSFAVAPLKEGRGIIEFHKSDCTTTATTLISGRRAVYLAIAKEIPSLLPESSGNTAVEMDQWLDFSTDQLSVSLQKGGIDLLHKEVFDPLQDNLAGKVFLSGSISPSIADWVLYSRVRNILKAMVPSHALKFFRIIRWINHLECLLGNSTGIFDMKELKSALNCGASNTAGGGGCGGSITSTKAGSKAAKVAKAQKTKEIPSGPPISRIDLRVGKITKIEKHPNASRLYVESVVFGEEGDGEERTVVSGLVDHCAMEDLEGRLCLFVCNLKPASLCKIMSSGMLLVAKERGGDGDENLKLEPLCIEKDSVKPGDRVEIEGITFCPDERISSKSGNVWELVRNQLEVIDGVVYWMGDGVGEEKDSKKKLKLLINGTEIRSTLVPNGIVS